MTCKHWCFTLNNYTEDEVQLIESRLDHFKYIVYGYEVGESGTPHLQGFVSFPKRKALNTVKNLISARAHLEKAKGSPAQASEYCKKDGNFVEHGECPKGRGARSDLVSLYNLIRDGAEEQEVEETFPAQIIKYDRSVRRLLRKYQPLREIPPTVTVIWGPTGTGKTRFVYDTHGAAHVYSHPGGGWFDGYRGQQVALFDDFGGHEFKLTYLLKLLDRYPMMVPVKGGFVNWVPELIYITSNVDPANWYSNISQEHTDALFRRFTSIENKT